MAENRNALVKVQKQRNSLQELQRKYDDRIPDDVWLKLQEAGEEAADHLLRILQSPGFEKRKIHEQIRVIELAMLRAYGAPEGAVKRPAKPEPNSQEAERTQRIGNSLARLADKAVLPELQPKDKHRLS